MSTQAHPTPVHISSFRFLKYYGITMRPYLLFVSGITGLVGMSFSQQSSLAKTALLFTASFLAYGFGQALTDCFQIDTDSLSAPYRPLTQGVVSRIQILVVSVLGLAYCISVFAYYNPINFLFGTISGIGLATYTPFKRRWWGGPFYNSWIVALLCVMAFLTGGKTIPSILSVPFAWLLLAVFFGYANFVLSGYFKDIDADRPTGYRTLPVVFGRKVAAAVSDIFAVLSIVFALIVIHQATDVGVSNLCAIAFAAGGIVAAIIGQVQLHNVNTDEEAHKAITPVVHSYVLLLSSIAAFQQPGWQLPLVAYYGLFVLVMKFRTAQNQV